MQKMLNYCTNNLRKDLENNRNKNFKNIANFMTMIYNNININTNLKTKSKYDST